MVDSGLRFRWDPLALTVGRLGHTGRKPDRLGCIFFVMVKGLDSLLEVSIYLLVYDLRDSLGIIYPLRNHCLRMG